jgi:hypothetical protein
VTTATYKATTLIADMTAEPRNHERLRLKSRPDNRSTVLLKFTLTQAMSRIAAWSDLGSNLFISEEYYLYRSRRLGIMSIISWFLFRVLADKKSRF